MVRTLRTVPPVFLLLACAPAGAEPAHLVRLNERGIEYLLNGRPAAAAAAFEEALADRPGDPVLQRNLAAALATQAEAARKERALVEAIRLLERAVRLHPGRLRYRVLLGRARFEDGAHGNRLAARDDFERVLARDPDHLDALVNLGQIAYVDRRLEEAVGAWRRALALRPADTDIRRRLEKASREFGVERSFEQLQAANFRLRYAKEIQAERAAAVLHLCEEAYGKLSKDYRSFPEKIAVTLYTPAQFRSATNLHGWVAGLSDGTIRLTVHPRTSLDALRATIYHELAHHLIRARAERAPVWLHEGLAQLAEEKSVAAAEGRLRRSAGLRAAELSAQILREQDPRMVSRFYDLALAFTHHLFQSRGYAGLDELLEEFGSGRGEEEALRAVFGQGRNALFDEWRGRLGLGAR